MRSSADGGARMCPSTPVSNATVFLGMISTGGRVAYVSPAVPVTAEDIATLPTAPGRTPESTYRFAGPCVEGGCGHWSGSHCRLGEEMATHHVEVPEDARSLPKCAIRPQCRWYAEQGADACTVCQFVTTDLRAPARG